MMGWGSQGYGMWGMGWFGGIVMVLFWAAVIIGIVLLIRYFTAGHGGISASNGVGPVSREQDPLEILKERFARGEIDTREYEERKKVLDG